MRRKTIFLFLLTASIAATGGCHKKEQDKMDLNSVHTSAAETMASETEDQETTHEETTAPETSADSKNPAAVSGSSTKLETYHPKDFPSGSISYPVITHMKDEAKQERINNLLFDNATSICDTLAMDQLTALNVDCKVISMDSSRITVVYQADYSVKDAAYPGSVFYTNTVDLNQVKSLGINDYSDAYTMAGYLMSDDVRFVDADPELTSALWDYRSEQTIDFFTNILNKADFPLKTGDSSIFPESFSYLSNSTLYFSIPVPHALGDYAIIAYPMDGK